MTMKNKIIYIFVILVTFLLGIILGFYLKKDDVAKFERIVEVKWQKGDTIRDTLYRPKPYRTIVRDSVKIPVYTDTAALFAAWKDYTLSREYRLDFSNDSVGQFVVDALVTENKLMSAVSTIRPLVKTIYTKETEYKKQKFVPWAIIGSSVDFKTNKVQLGVDLSDRYIVGVSGIRMKDVYGYTIDVGYRFTK